MSRLINFLSVVALVGGVMAGVVLVQQNQDFREKAGKEDKVKVCHKTGSDDNPFNQIEVAEPAVQAHLDHGDSLGDCPSPPSDDQPEPSSDPTQAPDPTQEPTSQPTSQPTVAPVPADPPAQTIASSPITSTQPEASPSVEPEATDSSAQSNQNANTSLGTGSSSENNTNNTNTSQNTFDDESQVADEQGQFTFRIGLQAIKSQGPNKNATIAFFRDGNLSASRNAEITSDDNGVYTGVTLSVPPGYYEVIVKVNGYLARRFRNVGVVSGNNLWNWGALKLITGDFDNNNIFNLHDIGLFLSEYTSNSIPVNAANIKFDVNNDKLINDEDLNIILANYNTLNLPGDN